jgi:hydrogenase-4 component F
MELIIILSSFLIAVVISLLTKKRGIMEFVSVIASLIAFIGSIIVAVRIAMSGAYVSDKFFYVDALGAILILIISLIGLMVTMYSVAYLREETDKKIIGFTRVKQYFVLLNLFLAAMFLTVVSNSPIVAWISIEATTLSTAFLISFYNKPSAMEAAWKYLIINSIGLLLGFLGTLIYFVSSHVPGGAVSMTWASLLSSASSLDPTVAKIAFVFVLIGYGTKVGLAPMHTWLPDAHSKAPAPISALLSGVLLNVAFFLVLRFKIISDISVGSYFTQNLLIAFGLLSMFVASIIILTQRNYKRLLAYSSIENMGVVALGFGFGGLGIFAGILHMVYHSLIKSALFFSAGNIFLKYSSTKIAKIRGVITALPITGILFMVGFFIITGTPPFGIFFTKIFILSAGINIHPIVTIIAILLMALLFIGFFKHVADMMFGEKPEEVKIGEGKMWLIVPPISLILIACYLSFHIPSFLNNLLNMVALHY